MNKTTAHCKIAGKLLLITVVILLAGCATTQNNNKNIDPLEPVNRKFFTFNETLDRYFMKPVATTYIEVTPQPIRTGVTNFFDNLTYMNVVVNSFFQGKFDEGMSGLFRFIFNTTLGIGGLFDIATHMGLTEHDEDTGQTLAVWGMPQGPYLTVPLFGPNTVRDSPNLVTRSLANPFTYISGSVFFPITALGLINTRANLLKSTSIRDEAAIDTYSFTREAYLQQRKYLIYDGNPPGDYYEDLFPDEFDDMEDDPALIIE